MDIDTDKDRRPTQEDKAKLMRRFLDDPDTVEERAARMADAILRDDDDFLPSTPAQLIAGLAAARSGLARAVRNGASAKGSKIWTT